MGRLNMKALLFIHLVSLAGAGNIVEEMGKAGATTLISLVEKAGLVSTLEGDGPFTVFAPDNAAFAALPAELVNTLVADTELLKTVLLNHVLVGKVLSTDISNDIVVDAAGGAKLRANIYSKGKWYPPVVTINGKAVKKADILADNGVIHVLSEVLADTASGTIADVASGDERFSTLVSLVVQAGLAETCCAWNSLQQRNQLSEVENSRRGYYLHTNLSPWPSGQGFFKGWKGKSHSS